MEYEAEFQTWHGYESLFWYERKYLRTNLLTLHKEGGQDVHADLLLAWLPVCVLRTFIKFKQAPTKFNEALPSQIIVGLSWIEILIKIDFRYHIEILSNI